jgi:hypothetical protein
MEQVSRMKQVVQFIFDPEIYCLAWIAVKNQFRKPSLIELPKPDTEEKSAKAAQGGG